MIVWNDVNTKKPIADNSKKNGRSKTVLVQIEYSVHLGTEPRSTKQIDHALAEYIPETNEWRIMSVHFGHIRYGIKYWSELNTPEETLNMMLEPVMNHFA